MPEQKDNTSKQALDALFWREEILQVLYWMDGEGLADAVPFVRLMVLLNTDSGNLLLHLKKNIEAGFLKTEDDAVSEKSAVLLTPDGKKEAGGIFRSAFEGMQNNGHGECGPD